MREGRNPDNSTVAIRSIREKIDDLVVEHTEQARGQRVAEAIRMLRWNQRLFPTRGSKKIDDDWYRGTAEAYVNATEALGE